MAEKKAKRSTKRSSRQLGKISIDGKEMQVLQEPGGTGLTAIIRGNTKDEVWRIVSEMQAFSMENGLEQVEVMSIQPSPAGGWEAIVRAHNFNPLKWAKDAAQSGWQKTAGARQAARSAASTAGGKVAATGRRAVRGMSQAQWDALEAEFDALPPSEWWGTGTKPTRGTPGYRQAVMSLAEKKKRERKTAEQVAKYGVETRTPPRKVEMTVPVFNPQTGKMEPQKFIEEVAGKEYSQTEIQKRLARAKKEAGPSFGESAAKLAKGAIEGAAKYGTVAAVGTGQMAQRPMGTRAFQRGAGTFGPDRGMTPFVAAPSPAAQQRLMASTVMPGIPPVGGLKPLSPGVPVGSATRSFSAPSVLPTPAYGQEPATRTGVIPSAPKKRTRVPSVLPNQQYVDMF